MTQKGGWYSKYYIRKCIFDHLRGHILNVLVHGRAPKFEEIERGEHCEMLEWKLKPSRGPMWDQPQPPPI